MDNAEPIQVEANSIIVNVYNEIQTVPEKKNIYASYSDTYQENSSPVVYTYKLLFKNTAQSCHFRDVSHGTKTGHRHPVVKNIFMRVSFMKLFSEGGFYFTAVRHMATLLQTKQIIFIHFEQI